MENIWKIIYDLSINDNLLNISNIDKILEILIDEKDLGEYILNIEVQQMRSNNLASYSNYYKKIVLYSNVIDKMIADIHTNIKTNNNLTKNLYINLSVLQVILHELEHANQEKIINCNTLESFILRISQIVKSQNQIYEFNPIERFAEIKSYNDLLKIVNYENDLFLKSLIKNDELQRKIRGYHYFNGKLYSPIELYFIKGKVDYLLSSFEWYSDDNNLFAINVDKMYSLEDSLFYGFPILDKNYYNIMNNLITNLNKNYKNKINIIKKY